MQLPFWHIPLGQSLPQHCLQLPPQSLVPDGQLYEQVPFWQEPTLPPLAWLHIEALQHWVQQALQLLLPQSLVPAGQLYWQVPPAQRPTLFPRGEHCPSLQHSLHVPSAHMTRFPLHLRSHLFPSQVAVALGEVGQGLHELVPQELTLRLSLHSLPQR